MVEQLRAKGVRGGLWSASSSIFRAVLYLTQLAVLARYLGPQDFGLMALVLVIVGLSQIIGSMGITNAIIHFKNPESGALSTVYWFNIGLGVTLYALVVAAAPAISFWLDEPELERLLVWGGVAVPVNAVGQSFRAILQRELMFRDLAVIDVIGALFSTIVAIWMAVNGYGVWALVWGALVNQGVGALVAIIVGGPLWRPRLVFAPLRSWRFLRFGLFQTGDGGLKYLATQLDRVFIGDLVGAHVLGYYSLGMQLMMRPIEFFGPVLTRVGIPILAHVQEDRSRLIRGFLEMTRIQSLFLVPLYALGIALAPRLVQVLLGPEWSEVIPIFRVLCLVGISFAVGRPIGTLIVACGKPDWGLYLNVVTLIGYFVAVSIGARWEAIGVAWALVVVQVVVVGPSQMILRWWLAKISPLAFFRAIGPALVASFIGCLVAWAAVVVMDWLSPNLFDIVVLGIGSGLGACSVLLVAHLIAPQILARVQRDLYHIIKHPPSN